MSALPQISYSVNIECMDCKKLGHLNKAYHECKFYKAVLRLMTSLCLLNERNLVGSSGKKQAKTTGDIKCISCDLKGHSASHSLEWKSCQGLCDPTRTIL
ncbi:hypothetical protein BDF20DRAFT_842596 [Mycotypha africana]|uniref:uncharacterized protein n=1 Tax=Mycotypha africana TaxID=64632 RepID=UPI002300ED94|nr:uncharacterized protein BDF20DRAFT_842596 [Mycotypha africana]KAI8991094.1 hypothetical protein BDF20DRAFT_842596 [Mycotypha africana]